MEPRLIRIALLDDYQRVAETMADWTAVRARADLHVFHEPLGGEGAVASALAGFDIIGAMRDRTTFSRAVIEQLPKLRFLTVTGPYCEKLDMAAANDRGVIVSATGAAGGSSPGFAQAHHATPELTWALILAVTRNLAREDRAVRAGGWQHAMGRVLHGRTLGVVGLGNIGKIVAGYARAFGMKVIAWSPNLTDERAAAVGACVVDKETLFRTSDVVTVHLKPAPSLTATVGANEIGLMKPDAIIVNTSRAALIDEAAMIEALATRRIAGAGLDVFSHEPLPPDHPLRRLENVVLTPHIGYVTEEQYRIFYSQTAENILAFLDGAPIRVINRTEGLIPPPWRPQNAAWP
jgi:phosphoglycerate dehydrogenase-like enzyme